MRHAVLADDARLLGNERARILPNEGEGTAAHDNDDCRHDRDDRCSTAESKATSEGRGERGSRTCCRGTAPTQREQGESKARARREQGKPPLQLGLLLRLRLDKGTSVRWTADDDDDDSRVLRNAKGP